MVLIITPSPLERLYSRSGIEWCRISANPSNGHRVGSEVRRVPKSFGRGKSLATQTYAVKQTCPDDVYLLDFDGVLVDSEPEVTHSALQASRLFWPNVFENITGEKLKRVENGMTTVRPVLVKGFEAVIMARMLAEDDSCIPQILASWETVWPAKLKEWATSSTVLSGYFDGYRTGSFIADRGSWVRLNKPYPGIAENLPAFDAPFYIASSKSARRLLPLLKDLFHLDFPPDSPRIFSSLLPPSERKVETLREVKERPIVKEAGARLNFIDDRWETLKAVMEASDLDDVRLYFATWGYSTPEEKEEASKSKRVRNLGLNQFTELLKWGILMGVDDGCEPEMHEILAGVTATPPAAP
eukprot:jgi/Botrbrau1/22187/Bobra.168_1s0019.1